VTRPTVRARASAFGRRAGRSLAARTGQGERFAALEGVFDRGLARNRRDDEAAIAVLSASLPPDGTALDVGANRGDVLEHIVRVAPRGRHYAFEPVPSLAAGLRERFPGVAVREAACADAAGRSTFTIVVDEPALSGLRRRQDLGAEAGNLQEVDVEVVRLDDVVDPDLPLAFVKVDVEGAEVQALRGAHGLLRRHRPTVVFEHGVGGADLYGTTSEELWDLLDDCGLRIFDLAGDGPYERRAFAAAFTSPLVWNWLAVRG
jgi:FkbM family methyltransferase